MEFHVAGEMSSILAPLVDRVLTVAYESRNIIFQPPFFFRKEEGVKVVNGIVKTGCIPKGAKPNQNISAAQNFGFGLKIIKKSAEKELIIPMLVLRVKSREEGLLILDPISGPREAVEGKEVEFRMRLNRGIRGTARADELRVDVGASYSREPECFPLPHQVLYIPTQGGEVIYRFRPDPDNATEEERRQGTMKRVLTIAVSYREGRRTSRKSQTHCFSVRLNSEPIIRRVGNLGNILGLTPKSMR